MEKYSKEWIREYNKTWYWKIVPFWNAMTPAPNSWIVCTPIRLFGKVIAYKWKIAKENYKWNS